MEIKQEGHMNIIIQDGINSVKLNPKEWVSVESLLKDIKVIKKLVKKHRLEHAGLGWLEARLNGRIIELENY